MLFLMHLKTTSFCFFFKFSKKMDKIKILFYI